MILGCVLAGGQSTRFGSDKALAEFGGRTLIARAVDTLAGFCEHVIVAGRPLGGLAAALRFAQDEGYATVLTCGVDSLDLPRNLLQILSPAPAYLETQPVVGHWSKDAASIAEAILQSEGRHSMFAFAEAAGARRVKAGHAPANINTPADLAAIRADDGRGAEMEQDDGI